MARDDLHFRLRIPEDLKERIERASAENHRSMTAEIIARLELTFDSASSRGVASEAVEKIVRQAVANSLYHVTRSMAAIVEAGKQSEQEGKSVNYVGMVRQMADEFKQNYEDEMSGDAPAMSRVEERQG